MFNECLSSRVLITNRKIRELNAKKGVGTNRTQGYDLPVERAYRAFFPFLLALLVWVAGKASLNRCEHRPLPSLD